MEFTHAFFLLVAALLLDWFFGEPKRWHPLVGFGRGVQWLEQRLYRPTVMRGLLLLLLLVIPPVVVVAWFDSPFPAIVVLYFTLGACSLTEHAGRVDEALRLDDLGLARRQVGMMVSRNTAGMTVEDVSRATIESVLENGNDAIFGAIFWFLVAGPAGALLYRLVNTLDAMWGYRTPRYQAFGSAAARFDDLLNLIPARLTAFSYALLGNVHDGLASWRSQGMQWESPNAGPVMAAGAGALQLVLGGSARYHGQWRQRPTLGCGNTPTPADIPRAMALVQRGIVLWLLAIALIEGGRYLA